MKNLFLILAVFFLICKYGYSDEHEKNIIVLNSYHQGFPWTDGITSEIKKYFSGPEHKVELYIEYLDRKRFSDKSYMKLIPGYLASKYKDKKIALIIVTDDDALVLLREYERILFPSVPVVYSGINDLKIPDVLNSKRYTGILEETPPDGTLKLAMTLHPDVKHIYVLADYAIVGRERVKSLKMISGNYPGIKFEYSENTTIGEIKKRLSALDKKSIVLSLAFFNDSAGTFFSYQKLMSEIYPVLHVPVYTVSGNLVGLGITGGVVNSAVYQGREASLIAGMILNGVKPENIPVKRNIELQKVADYRELKRFGINMSLLPPDTLIINKPGGFYNFYKENMVLFLLLASFSFLAVIIILVIGRYKILRINSARLKVMAELQATLEEVSVLQGMLPICSNCKNIRNDKGYWEHIETYISEHSKATFTHSLCPDCVKKLYPDYYNKRLSDQKDKNPGG